MTTRSPSPHELRPFPSKKPAAPNAPDVGSRSMLSLPIATLWNGLMRRGRFRLVAGGVLAAAALGCGGQEINPVAPTGPTGTNRAPQASRTVPAQTVSVGEDIQLDMQGYFTDPDDDSLTFEATSSDIRVVSVSVVQSVVTIMALSAGTADITVTATDPGGLTAALTFTAIAEPPSNRAPMVSAPILGRTLKLNESEKASVDLSLHFADPDGDPMTFEATSSDPQIATVSVSNSTVTILAQDLGTATVSVTATDSDGLTATQAFSVNVEPGALSAELEVTKCRADGLGFVNVTVEGTVRALAPLSSARVTAYLDTQQLGEQTLGNLAAGETLGFLIRGSATVGSSSRCLVEFSAGRRNMTAGAAVSLR